MLFKSAVIILVTWLVGVLFFRGVGDVIHVPLLIGLALLLLSFLRAREAAMRSMSQSHPDKK